MVFEAISNISIEQPVSSVDRALLCRREVMGSVLGRGMNPYSNRNNKRLEKEVVHRGKSSSPPKSLNKSTCLQYAYTADLEKLAYLKDISNVLTVM